MMGVWFLASAYGQYLAGWIGSLMAIPGEEAGKGTNAFQSLLIYAKGYGRIALISVISGVVLILLARWLGRMMKTNEAKK